MQENVAAFDTIVRLCKMKEAKFVHEKDLADLAKKHRIAAGITKAQAARDMRVKQPSIFHAEKSPDMPYTKLRLRMIGAYSDFEAVGPVYLIRKKKSKAPQR